MTPSIPLVDLKAAYRRLQAEIDAATARVLAGGWYILGPEVSAFEAEFAAYLGVEHAVGVASGTDAVLLALRALGVGPGDEVITVAHTAVATVAVSYTHLDVYKRQNLAHRLVALGAEVLILDSLIPEYGGNVFNIHGLEDRLRVNIADMRDEHGLRYLVQGQDVIFNLAGQVSHTDSMTDPYTDLELSLIHI